MPTPTSGPGVGQHFKHGSPEMAAYLRDNPGVQFVADEGDAADQRVIEDAMNNTVNESPAEYWDRQAKGIPHNRPYEGSFDPSQLRDQAIAGTQANQWDNYFAQRQGVGMAMPGFDAGLANNDRLNQQRVIQELQAQAAGNMNSQAQQQLGQGYQQARAQQSSLGSSIRGQSAGAAQRGIMQGQQGLQRGFAGDQQMLKLQEQQAAQAALQQLLAQQYGQDVGQAQAMGMGALQGNELNQQMQQFYDKGAFGRIASNYQYGADLGAAQLGQNLDARNLENENTKRALQAIATAGGVISSMPSSSTNQNSGFRQVSGQNSIVPFDDK